MMKDGTWGEATTAVLEQPGTAAAAEITEWTMDPAQGSVQGPLDLGFFANRSLRLVLQRRQVALLTGGGHLKGVFFAGAHVLDVGEDGDRIPPDFQLAFLDLDQVFTLSWSRMNPVLWGRDRDQALIGKCSLRITGPEAFYRAFLAGNRYWEPAFLQRLIEQVARGAIEAVLADAGLDPRSVSFTELQARITRLHAQDIACHLEVCGLGCENLAVYTAAPPVGEGVGPRQGIDPDPAVRR